MRLIDKAATLLNRTLLSRLDLAIVKASLPDNDTNVMNFAPRDSLGSWVLSELDGGDRLWIDLGDYGVSRPCMSGVYEPLESAFVRSVLKPGSSFIDIGANIGWFTILAAKIVGPNGHVYAFEPRPMTCERLRMSVAENGYKHVEVRQVALGAETGRLTVATLLSAHNPGGTWLLATEALDTNLRDGYERFDVDVVRLDDLKIERCDLLKIDVEGAEHLALSGAIETLKRLRPIIISEINPDPLRQVSNSSPVEYVEFLKVLGYTGHEITADGPGAVLPPDFAETLTDMANVAFLP